MSQEIESHVLEQYKVIKKLGSGAYGHVWKVSDRKSEEVRALKKNFDAFSNSTDAQRTYREVMFLKQLKHENIIVLESIIRAHNDKDIYLVFQHMDIDLHTLIRENNHQQHLQEKHKKFIFYQVAKAIYYLHNSNIIHRDLKPSNILINQSCEAKLCDFGLVRLLEQDDQQEPVVMTDYIATRWYRAPQLLMGCKNYSKEIDIWALGCLVGELFRGKPLFAGTSTINQIERLLTWTGAPSISEMKNLSVNLNKAMLDLLNTRKKANKLDFFSQKINSSCMDLISKMLEFDPKKRLTIEQVLRHEYLNDFYSEKDMKEIRDGKIKIQLHIDENTKLSVKNYRDFIYADIKPKQKVLGHSNHNFRPIQNNHHRQHNPSVEKAKAKKINDENYFKSKEQTKIISNQRVKTQVNADAEQKQDQYLNTVYQTGENKQFKQLPIKQSKSSIGRKSSSKTRQTSVKKKGISLCSKDMMNQSSSLCKKKYSDCESLDKDNRQAILNNPIKKIKTTSKSSSEKYEKIKKQSLYEVKPAKKIMTGYFINENIGKKQYDNQ